MNILGLVMRTARITLFAFLALLISCGDDSRVVDNFNETTMAYYSTETNPDWLGLIELPSGSVVSQDIYYDKNGERLGSRIYKVITYYNEVFLFLSDAKKIVVISPETYVKKYELDFTQDSLDPLDIVFPNSTDAYVVFRNSPQAWLFDLTNGNIARKIDINGIAADVEGDYSNQIFVANPDKNTVSVIDSRTHKEEAVIDVAPVPMYIKASTDRKKMFVVSIGNGKTNTLDKSAATLTVISTETRQVLKTYNIGSSQSAALEEIPVGIDVTSDRLLFIATKDYLYRYDYKVANSVVRSRKDNYMSICYNSNKDHLMFLTGATGNATAVLADSKTGAYGSETALPAGIQSLYKY